MTRLSALSVGCWAHHSWLLRATPVRSERALGEASAQLLARYPQLAQIDLNQTLPYIGALPRTACARLLRVSAALAGARALRRVVASSARDAFARSVAPHVLRAIQQHPRGSVDDAPLSVPLNFFDRRDMTAAGLALSLRGLADGGEVQHLWLRLRLPSHIAERAAHYNANELSAADARALLDDAWHLLRGEAC